MWPERRVYQYYYLTVDQLDKPIAIVHVIGLTGGDTAQLIAHTRVLLGKHHKLVCFLNQLLQHQGSCRVREMGKIS